VPHAELVRSGEGALGHGKVPNRIQQVGLALPVSPGNAVYVRGKGKLLESDIPEILNDYFLESRHLGGFLAMQI
jgi:hypothetical protein